MNFRAFTLLILILLPQTGVSSAFDLESDGPRLTIRGFSGGMHLLPGDGIHIHFVHMNESWSWYCSSGIGGVVASVQGCPSLPTGQNRDWCRTEADAIALFYKYFVGRTLVAKGKPMVAPYIEFACSTGPGQSMWYIREDTSSQVPASCSASGDDIHLRGVVGERLKGAASWRVQCDKRADVRLTIEGNGDVPLDGGGVVNLRFRESGRSVLEIDSDTPSMHIDGELRTALPAGVYRGAAIIRLDVI